MILGAGRVPRKKYGQIVAFGEAGQLRGVAQPHVDQSADPEASQGFEEVLRRVFLVKPIV